MRFALANGRESKSSFLLRIFIGYGDGHGLVLRDIPPVRSKWDSKPSSAFTVVLSFETLRDGFLRGEGAKEPRITRELVTLVADASRYLSVDHTNPFDEVI